MIPHTSKMATVQPGHARREAARLLQEGRAPVEHGETHDIDEEVGHGQPPDHGIEEDLLAQERLELLRRIVFVELRLGALQFGQADRLGRIAQRNDDEDHAQHRDGSRNPERPLPGADMLQRIGDIGFGRSGVHLFGDARRILHDALPHLRIARHIRTRVAHQIPAQDRDDEGADRVRSVPDRHLGRQLLGRNPMRDQAVARREAAPLEHVVQNQQHAEQDDQRMDERRPVGLPRNPCADDRTAAENEVDDRTHRQARHHVPTAVGASASTPLTNFDTP